jgi:hypothetical protein
MLIHLATADIIISVPTLIKARRILGLVRAVACAKPFIMTEGKCKGLKYVQKHVNCEWRKVIFCDEASVKIDNLVRTMVTRPVVKAFEPHYLQPRFRSGVLAIMLWGVIWHGGRSKLVMFDPSESTGKSGGVTGDIYREQITEGPLYNACQRVKTRWRGYGTPTIVEDNTRVHTKATTRGKGQQMGMVYHDHPPYSPCLNPIEHAWAWLKPELSKQPRRPTTAAELFEVASGLWDAQDQSFFDNLVDSMGGRIQATIAAHGGPIPY